MTRPAAALVVAALLLLMRLSAPGGDAGRAAGPAAGPPASTASAATPAAPVGAHALTPYAIDPSASQVEYRVAETVLGQGTRSRTVVGETQGVEGTLFVDRTHPQSTRIGPIVVNVSQLRSDSARRDAALQTRWLDSARYPTAVFTPRAIVGLPATLPQDGTLLVGLVGDLAIHNITKPVTFAATVTVGAAAITGTADGTISLTDYGIAPPSLLDLVRASDRVQLEIRFTARPVP